MSRGKKSEDRGQRSGIGGQQSGIGDRRSEVRDQVAENLREATGQVPLSLAAVEPGELKGALVAVSTERELGTVIGYQDTFYPKGGGPDRNVKLFIELESGRGAAASREQLYLVPRRHKKAVRQLLKFLKGGSVA